MLAGLAVTEAPVVAERPVAGLQENEFAPAALSVVLPPAQIDGLPLTVITGVCVTLTVTEAVALQPAEVPVTV